MRTLLVALALAAGAATRAEAQSPTVRPGMTVAEVKAAWGAPSAERTRGSFTYLTFPTACLPGCGTHDIVILQDGKVIDAIARSNGRRYEGNASYTARVPGYTAPAGATAAPR
ncbi:MAG TPA: hypothetical protein VFY20_12200 [Gemmatimonadales bacterium]|nr:hypothetical protein [Gemmatimonadales bacterium]